MASYPVTGHCTQRLTTSDDRLDVPKPEAATVLRADFRNAENLEFDKADEIALLKKKNYKVHMFVKIASNMSRPMASVYDSGAGPNVFCKSFLPVEWCDCICPINKMSLKPASNSPVNVKGKTMLYVQLGDIHIGVHFSIMENLAVPLLIGTWIIKKFVKGVLPKE